MTKHLYIHIPFCHQICKFCDFKRTKTNNFEMMEQYINKIIQQITIECQFKQFKTIYLGGGTPNYLPSHLLGKFLSHLKKYLDSNYEFTIECNPDLINDLQADIFYKNGINRVSLGVQSTNNKVLKQMNRTHTIEDAIKSIEILKNHNITNISCDFIYNLPGEENNDLLKIADFIVENNIPHVSVYSLEIKENAILNKHKYKINQIIEEDKLEIIKKIMSNIGFNRYEVSNWCKTGFESQHNLAYWLTNDWKAIGYGAHGFENLISYEIGNKINDFFITKKNHLLEKDYYFQILMMGLRLNQGIDISIEKYYKAYSYFKDKLINIQIVNNYLSVKNIDLLDDTLLNLLDD